MTLAEMRGFLYIWLCNNEGFMKIFAAYHVYGGRYYFDKYFDTYDEAKNYNDETYDGKGIIKEQSFADVLNELNTCISELNEAVEHLEENAVIRPQRSRLW